MTESEGILENIELDNVEDGLLNKNATQTDGIPKLKKNTAALTGVIKYITEVTHSLEKNKKIKTKRNKSKAKSKTGSLTATDGNSANVDLLDFISSYGQISASSGQYNIGKTEYVEISFRDLIQGCDINIESTILDKNHESKFKFEY